LQRGSARLHLNVSLRQSPDALISSKIQILKAGANQGKPMAFGGSRDVVVTIVLVHMHGWLMIPRQEYHVRDRVSV